MQYFLGFFLAAFIAMLARKTRSLSRSGAHAATATGAIIFGLGGWQWAILLLTFFISSTALTRAFKQRKKQTNEKYSKGGERDAGQVIGNGGVATFFVVLGFVFPHATWPWLGFAAALAAVNADTWATELGILNPHPPRLISDLRKVVEKGTSGGISLVGTLASLMGAGLIGLESALFSPLGVNWTFFFFVTIAGLLGSLFDSLLGATTQAIYFCPTCKKETERYPTHSCGTQTNQIRGWKWLDNDWVNFACGAFGAGMGLVLQFFF